MDMKVGDIIAVTSTPEDGWWSGELVREGRRFAETTVFPSNFVIKYSVASSSSPVSYDMSTQANHDSQSQKDHDGPPKPLGYTSDGRPVLFYG